MEKVNLEINTKCALLIVDIQNDFLPGGALAVADGDKIINDINILAENFYDKKCRIVFTQDWHPKGHGSFASAHPGKKPGDPINTDGLGPVLWPDHCVQNTKGAEISEKIETKYGICTIRKGYHKEIDSYSAFFENDKKTKTGLGGFLKELGIEKVFICGLALDYCCFYSAIDATSEGFQVFFLKDLMKGIDIPENNIENSINKMKEAGISIISGKKFSEFVKI